MVYSQPSVQVKRKAEKQGDSGIKRKSRPAVEATKSFGNGVCVKSPQKSGPDLEATESLVKSTSMKGGTSQGPGVHKCGPSEI